MEVEKFAAHHKVRWFLSEYIIVVIGVITALSAQQTVEYFNHRQQLQEARRELRSETEENRRDASKNLEVARAFTAQLNENMALLRSGRGWPPEKASYHGSFEWPPDGAWQAVKQNGSLSLMPHDELARYAYVYDIIASVKSSMAEFSRSLFRAEAISGRSPGGTLAPRDIEELTTAISDAQGKVAFCDALLRYEELGLERIHY